MATQIKHAPLPWKIERPDSCDYRRITEADEARLVSVYNTHDVQSPAYRDVGIPEMQANAAFITRACNSHYELVEALHLAKKLIKQSGMAAGSAHTVIDAALARATGQEEK